MRHFRIRGVSPIFINFECGFPLFDIFKLNLFLKSIVLIILTFMLYFFLFFKRKFKVYIFSYELSKSASANVKIDYQYPRVSENIDPAHHH